MSMTKCATENSVTYGRSRRENNNNNNNKELREDFGAQQENRAPLPMHEFEFSRWVGGYGLSSLEQIIA